MESEQITLSTETNKRLNALKSPASSWNPMKKFF